MIVRSDLERMKENLDSIVGQEIQLTTRQGRENRVTQKGIIEGTYPNIFIVRLRNAKNNQLEGRRISYSYADILTKAIEVKPFATA